MLFNPDWKKEAKEPSLDGFIEWLETQNPKTKYNFCDLTSCAVARYMKTIGLPVGKGLYSQAVDKILGRRTMVREKVLLEHDQTLGSVLKEAKKLKEKVNA